MRRVLLLGGGGFKGAAQVPVCEHLAGEGRGYDEVRGVSVGALNGALVAQGQLGTLAELWAGVRSRTRLGGVPGFLAPAWWRWRGWYSLAPLAAVVERHLAVERLRVPFGCGVVARETGDYRTLVFRPGQGSDAALHLAVLGSCAIAGVMEPEPFPDDELGTVLLSDGGHRHTVPPAPADADQVDVVLCQPLEPELRPTCCVDRLGEAWAWALDTQLDAQLRADLDALRARAAQGCLVRVWAPPEPLGGLLDASRGRIAWRQEVGRRMVEAGPVVL